MRIDRLAPLEFHETWSLREDTTVEAGRGAGDAVVLGTHWGDLVVPGPSPLLAEALRRMSLGSVSLRNVVPDFPGYDTEPEGCSAAARSLLGDLTVLQHLLDRTLSLGAMPLLTVVPLSPEARFSPRALPPGAGRRRARLLPATRLVHTGRELHLESPRSRHRVELHRPEAVCLIDGRAGLVPPDLRAAARLPQLALPEHVAAAGVAYLVAAGMASVSDFDDEYPST
ncbi:hypothetical protein LO771_29120 [Streptacidiphilus sp. ASG 303]|uniref:hypothetical protein n=1 Tax=Streptacidiphilus sp. ASG 303 TaxID=2896847 RepID=UPI001E5D6931|nr:hypothetical protein [Streptacidiphilus sp. ASG 303]MCD0486335.1 hypothetical protein [Streptacidiphilus sp. ASG 303]